MILCSINCRKNIQDEADDYVWDDEIELEELSNALTASFVTFERDSTWAELGDEFNAMDSILIQNGKIGDAAPPPPAPPVPPEVYTIPQMRKGLEALKMVVKIYDGKNHAGVNIPGFGGLKLDKSQSNLNICYVETKVVDITVYGIGYSIHYLFNKVKRGIEIKNLASVAASAQLQNNKTSVSYSLQSFGITGNELAKFFKPEVNSNFDVEGFALIQSKIDGIHNVITDTLLSARTKFTPEILDFLVPDNL